MIYFINDTLTIRDLVYSDIELINQSLRNQQWSEKKKVLEERLEQSKNNQLISIVAYINDEIAGMVYLHPSKSSGPYQDVPFIEDLLVFQKFQGKHIATKLMDVVENIAKKYSDRIALSVGIHSGYGKAQVLYVKRGYVPSGCGIYYQNLIATPYALVNNDDDLLLYFSKDLKR